MPKKILFFTPTLNEFGNVDVLIRELVSLIEEPSILVIDDGSIDGTVESLTSMTSCDLVMIRRPFRMGIGSAHFMALQYAYSNSFDYLVTFDADGTHQARDIVAIANYHFDFDLVIGSRFLSPSSMSALPFSRRILSKLGHYVTILGFGIKSDCSSALRSYNLKALDFAKILVDLSDTHYDFFQRSIYKLTQEQCQIRDVSITLLPRNLGSSKLSLSLIVRSVFLLLFEIALFRLRILYRYLISI